MTGFILGGCDTEFTEGGDTVLIGGGGPKPIVGGGESEENKSRDGGGGGGGIVKLEVCGMLVCSANLCTYLIFAPSLENINS